MRRTVLALLTLCFAVVFTITLRSQSPAPGAPATGPTQPATQAGPSAPGAPGRAPAGGPPPFKNVKLLTDVPREQFIPTMAFMGGSLGVGCEFCHDTYNFDSDDKKEKQTARTMIQLTRDINQKFFEGNTEVTCQTCHRGSPRPVSRPDPMQAHWLHPEAEQENAAARQNLPSADQLIAKYRSAVGIGNAPKITTQVVKITGTQQDGRGSVPTSSEISVSGDRALVQNSRPQGDSTMGVTGAQGWVKDSGGVHPADPRIIAASKESLTLLEPDQVGTLTATRVRDKEKVNGRDAYVVMGKSEDGQMRIFYFDAENGLLLRKQSFVATAFGRMPVNTDYADYQTVSGYKLPQSISIFSLLNTRKAQIVNRKINVPVDEKSFNQPTS